MNDPQPEGHMASYIGRRRFLATLLGGAAAAWPLAAQAQQPAMPVIGLLDQRSPDELADRLRGFRQGLRDSDFVEGQNVVIDYRWAQNKEDRLPELMVDFAKCLSRQVQSHKTAPQNQQCGIADRLRAPMTAPSSPRRSERRSCARSDTPHPRPTV